jgi:hypothetical protein
MQFSNYKESENLVESNRISPNIEAEVRETLKKYKEEFLAN